jgi:hypothetical protein
MKTLKIPFLVIIVVIVGWAQPQGCAADIPAGTTILTRTTKNINSDDPPGRAFDGVVARDIAVGGKVVIPVGGMVKSPHFTVGSTSRPLTLRLIGLTSHGRTIAIETENLQCESNSPLTIGPNRRVQITGDAFIYNAGTLIPFRLKKPVTI